MMVSIITVVRNGAATIESTIQSVIKQNYPYYEYIIIDGVSTDSTLDIIEKYKDKIALVISEPDKGIYDAINKGIRHAKGDWIYILGTDDILYDNQTLSKVFANDTYSEYDAVYGDVWFLQSNRRFDGKFDYKKLCHRSICQQAIFYRKEMFDRYGFFDTKYRVNADYVFNIISFCDNASKWHYVDAIIAIYNETGMSATDEDKQLKKDHFKIRYHNFKSHISKMDLCRVYWSLMKPNFLR